MSMNIIDISAWQKGISILQLKQKNPYLDGVIIKATGGTSYINPYFYSWANQCVNNKIPFGLYHFFKDDNNKKSAIEEADFFVDKVKAYIGHAILALDWEAQALQYPTSDALAFLNRVYERTGVKPLIYMSQSVVKRYNWDAVEKAGYKLWLAQYANTRQINGFIANPWYNQNISPWKDVAIHQYSSNLVLNGYNGNLDVNLAHMDINDWNGLSVPFNDKKPEMASNINTNKVYDPSVIINVAQKWYGKNELDGSHREIIDVYNSQANLPNGYRVRYTDAWCATFVSAVAIKAGYTSIIPVECSCPRMINLFKNMGCWEEDEEVAPEPGWIIFYDWQDGLDYKQTNNMGEADHVGIVMSVKGDTITVIEGNYHDSVGYRTIKVNGQYVRGYGVPRYTTYINNINVNVKSWIPNKEKKANGIVNASSLNIRLQPTTASGVCSFSPLSKNVIVDICDVSDDNEWFYIRYEGKYGFAYAKYITIASNNGEKIWNKDKDFAGRITASALNIRKQPTTSASVCSFSPLRRDTIIDVCDTSDDKEWYYIRYQDKYGFASAKYIVQV